MAMHDQTDCPSVAQPIGTLLFFAQVRRFVFTKRTYTFTLRLFLNVCLCSVWWPSTSRPQKLAKTCENLENLRKHAKTRENSRNPNFVNQWKHRFLPPAHNPTIWQMMRNIRRLRLFENVCSNNHVFASFRKLEFLVSCLMMMPFDSDASLLSSFYQTQRVRNISLAKTCETFENDLIFFSIKVSQVFASFRKFSQVFASFRKFSQVFATFEKFVTKNPFCVHFPAPNVNTKSGFLVDFCETLQNLSLLVWLNRLVHIWHWKSCDGAWWTLSPFSLGSWAVKTK